MTTNEILASSWTIVNPESTNIDELSLGIDRVPGLYSIFTNAPKEILSSTGIRNDSKHYNLTNKIFESDQIPSINVISQKDQNLYCVYNGHSSLLRQRFREHFNGTNGTACLAIFEIEILREYNWQFRYLNLSIIPEYIDSKIYRTLLEQHHRQQLGWPILCSQ
jgi:hypothetical protein